ncbi:helicase domino isoform X4 [Photinus pyralis]|uniref:helicase domino isoform X4 n=1 Tax=Photinus pyralis TaxID=7054 RepID=UPI00126716C9|nr:helicase domino isoform X4 [Photinus pyralis]
MSDESSGAGQGALPPREDFTSRNVVERPAVRLAQVAGGQYLLTSQTHGIPALAQISGSNASTANTSPGVTRIISLSPSRVHTSTLRPSLANQNIVNALTKPRATGNVRTQLFQATTVPNQVRSPVKRALSTTEEKDSYSVKLQRVMNHRNVRSKIVKEKYNEHLTEKYYLETSGNILDLPLFARRPPTPHYLTYLKENAIDPKEVMDDEETQDVEMKPDMTNSTTTVPTTPSASNSLDSFSSTNGLKVKATSSYSTPNNQEQIVEKAKQEAYVVQRISDLQKEGLWSDKRLPKIQEMPRVKAHWDFLIEEMVWLAADFAQERKWKKAAAKKCAKMVQKHFQDKASAAQRAEKAQEQHLKRVAAFCAKEIKSFWTNVEKLVEYKQNMRLEEKRKRALDQHLSFIVDQTEKYSQLLAEGMNKSVVNTTISEGPSAPSSKAPSRNNSDDEFQPDHESTDDEETIRQEEETAGEQGHGEEVAALQRESEMDLETFLNELPKDYLANRDKIQIGEGEETSDDDKGEGESTRSRQSEDEDFVADSSSEEDNEDTIKEQEKVEGKQNHKEELDDLKAENEVSVEDLRKKYSNLPPIPDAEDTPSDSDYSGSNGDGEDEDSSDASDVCSDVDISISESEDHEDEIGLKSLLDGSGSSQNEGDLKTDNQDLIDDAAAIAESIQPKGNTLSSTSVATPIPFLLRYTLREYQHIGLDWLVTMFDRKLNGILADEMGLGKTIQTIALLAHLACEKENWGPHLIIVPTSVMLNWEMECKKWCPAFKILTYYGTQKERKQKRMGWTKPNAFHICITSYKLVIQDHQSFRRKKWKYLILDEAQNIKNFKSQRWQLLLNFSTQQRLLLTGTPLQNNLMELWSLMHFLMPHVFQSHREFKEWFSNPVTGMIEGNSEYNESIIKRLHKVLRPFLLRRLKSEVEKQMPKKYEHIVMCRLSKRQRYLYDDYMSRAKTRETLATGNLLSVINVLMQLRKVCNHPNLFEVRPTISPFQCEGITWHIPSVVYAALEYDVWKHINLYSINFNLILMELYLSAYQCYRMRQYQTPRKLIEEINSIEDPPPYCPPAKLAMHVHKLQQPSDVKVDCKDEVPKPGQAINTQANLRLKIAPQSVLQLVQHNPLKVLAHQTGNGNQTIPTTVNLTTVLKQDKLMFQPGIAQLVQTSTGKHILLAPTTNATIPSNLIPGSTTVVTTGGQRLTLLPKQAVCAGQVTNITKGLPKIQLMSVNSQPSAGAPNISELKMEEEKETGRKTVGNTFINKLYSLQSNNLDVRWKKQKAMSPKRKHLINDKGEIEITDHHKNKLDLLATVNERRCGAVPLYGKDFQDSIKIVKTSDSDPLWCSGRLHCLNALFNMSTTVSDCLKDVLYTPERRIQQFKETFDRFIFYVPAVHAPEPRLQVWHPNSHVYWGQKREMDVLSRYFSKPATCLHSIASAMVTQFPDPRLIQYDCGKLQTLDRLLRKLKTDGHRVLIFTQMTKMLDVLEAFLNFHGHIYLRLDGSTKVDQRQVLMERFNSNTRIFAFILSTRSGGIGVNLTGADTVIFYDSDWNPTMDAQAQDRCHRIGQTRDVHIYRLVSERTIEENILKKANQKRLLGDLAIEGGNFTTAYFKSTTIQDLFNIDSNDESATSRMSEMLQMSREREKQTAGEQPIQNEEKGAMGALENALATCEDDQDVIAARTAKAEAVADLAEFDENIPLEDQEKDKEKEPELSKAEQEMENLVKQLTPVERYAMRFIEETEAAWSAEQLAAAEREIDEQKREWEQNRLAALKEEEERRARELEEENDMLTYSREDATNQIWVSDNTEEYMPMWCPPTPPQQDTDVYIDHTLSFLYDINVMSESQLPPVYIKKDTKRSRLDAGLIDSRRAMKIQRKDDSVYAPKSLFERPSPALVKMRRDLKLQKYRGIVRPPVPMPGVKLSTSKPATDQPCWHNWTVHEDMALLKVIQSLQGLPLNLMILSPGHTPNWDFVADYVNTVSITYRSPKQCRNRYETVIIPREEGKQIFDTTPRKKKNKLLYKLTVQTKTNRPMRTSQLYTQDNNCTFSQLMIQRYEALKSMSTKRTTTTKTVLNSPALKNPKHTAVLNECGIDIDHPVLPVEVAARRAERLAREKKSMTPEQLAMAQRIQLIKAGQMSGGQVTTIQTSIPQIAAVTTAAQTVVSAVSQTQTSSIVSTVTATVMSTAMSTPSTPPGQLRTQRIIAAPIQTPTVVSVSGLSPAQLQAATQRLIVSGTPAQAKAVVGATAAVTGKPITPAQLQLIRQSNLKQQQLRLQPGSLTAQAVKTSSVAIGGQTTVQVQFTQAQPRAQFLKHGTVSLANKQGLTRTVTEAEMAQIIKRQQQIQQQKVLAAAAAGGAQPTTVQNLAPQVYAQTIQQAGTSGTQVATLVKTVSSAGGITQTVTIPVTGVTIGGAPVKATLAPGIKTTTPPQIRHLQLQQQLLAQKKLMNQKIGITQVTTTKGGVATQLIVGSKPIQTAMTMQQLQQVMRTPLTGVAQGSMVLAKGSSRVIPVNTGQGGKQTIQMVAASQGLTTTIRPQTSSALAGALAGIKVQGATAQTQQALLTHVSALQGQNVAVRQNSPVRIQTASGTPLVAVTVQSPNIQQGSSTPTANTDIPEQPN